MRVWEAAAIYQYISLDKSSRQMSMDEVAQEVLTRAKFLIFYLPKQIVDNYKILLESLTELRSTVKPCDLQKAISLRAERAQTRAQGLLKLAENLKYLNLANIDSCGSEIGARLALGYEMGFCLLHWSYQFVQPKKNISQSSKSLCTIQVNLSGCCKVLIQSCYDSFRQLMTQIIPICRLNTRTHGQYQVQCCLFDLLCITDTPAYALAQSGIFDGYQHALEECLSLVGGESYVKTQIQNFKLHLRTRAIRARTTLTMAILADRIKAFSLKNKHCIEAGKNMDSLNPHMDSLNALLARNLATLETVVHVQQIDQQYFEDFHQNLEKLETQHQLSKCFWVALPKPIIFRYHFARSVDRRGQVKGVFGHSGAVMRVPLPITRSTSFWLIFRMFQKVNPTNTFEGLNTEWLPVLRYGDINNPLVVVSASSKGKSCLRFSLRSNASHIDNETVTDNLDRTHTHVVSPELSNNDNWLDVRLRVYETITDNYYLISDSNVLWTHRLAGLDSTLDGEAIRAIVIPASAHLH